MRVFNSLCRMSLVLLFLLGGLAAVYGQEQTQEGTVRGTVTDAQTGEAIPGVNVVIVGTTRGAATGADGTFTIADVSPGSYSLEASFIGYNEMVVEEVQVEAGGVATVDFALEQGEVGLEEVVVVGYGEQQRRDLTGAVSSLSAEELADIPSAGVEEAIQGKIAGVNVRPNSGEPGSPINIQIRGIGTFGNTSPLYVIDGVPVFNDVSGSGSPNPLNLINPNSIESIEVLKDASATAIYGARAANGVVLISTKRGRPGQTRVSVNLSSGVQNFANHIPMLNSREYAALANEADQAAGRPLQDALQDPANLEQNTNWQEAAFNPAPVQDYSATISGGTENSRFAVVGGYFNQQGILPGSGYKRYNMRINTDFNLLPNLQVGESVTLGRSKWWGGKTGGDSMVELLQSAPMLPVHDANNLGGFAGPTPDVVGRNARSNRIAEMHLIQNDEFQNRMLGNAYLDYEFLPALSYRLNLGADFIFGSNKFFQPVYELGARSNPTASLSRSESLNRVYLMEHTLSYDQTLYNLHDLSAVVGYTQQESFFQAINGSKQEFPSNDLRTIAAGLGQSNLNGNESEWAIRSFLGRVNYTFNSKYLMTATLRRDGSSRFGRDNRWGNFPSFSLGWRVSEEPFMQGIEPISDLKLRGGWGQVGNQAGIGNYASISTIEPVADYILGTDQHVAPGATYLALGNPRLRWETSEQVNVGLDADLFNSHFSIMADYYVKNTNGVLLRLPINTTSGIWRNSGPVVNAGKIQNSGFELAATYRKPSGTLRYNVSANLSTVANKVLSLGGGTPIINTVCADPACALTYTEVGREIGVLYGWVTDGLFNSQEEVDAHASQPGAAPGDIRFKDLNGDGTIDSEDRTILGSPLPDLLYGLSAQLGYQGFDFSFSFEGVQGRDLYNLQDPGIMDLQGDNNNRKKGVNRWTPQNKDTEVPRAVAGDPNSNDRTSDRFLEDGSFLRLNNLQVGYRFNVPNLISGASGLRVYVAARNLVTLTAYEGWNPDIGAPAGDPTLSRGIDRGTYPVARQFLGGLQVTL